MAEFGDRFNGLPQDIRKHIFRMLLQDINYRIAVGCIGKFKLPSQVLDVLRALPRPEQYVNGKFDVILKCKCPERPAWMLSYYRESGRDTFTLMNSGGGSAHRLFKTFDGILWFLSF